MWTARSTVRRISSRPTSTGHSVCSRRRASAWQGRQDVRFHHVSTDEVYGSLGETGAFFETTAYDPRSPYSASKAASDHLVRAYFHTYGLPVTMSNCSNNYGPYHFPEKLIPLMILNALEGKATSRVRRRKECAGLAVRGGPLRRGLADPAERDRRRDLQHRRRMRKTEHRGREGYLRHSGGTCPGRREPPCEGKPGIRSYRGSDNLRYRPARA